MFHLNLLKNVYIAKINNENVKGSWGIQIKYEKEVKVLQEIKKNI